MYIIVVICAKVDQYELVVLVCCQSRKSATVRKASYKHSSLHERLSSSKANCLSFMGRATFIQVVTFSIVNYNMQTSNSLLVFVILFTGLPDISCGKMVLVQRILLGELGPGLQK